MGPTAVNNPKVKAAPYILALALVVVFFVTWFSLEAPWLPRQLRHSRPSPQHLGSAFEDEHSRSIRQLLRLLYPPSTSVAATSFHDNNGVVWKVPDEPTWKKSLGRRLCIVDIDTRRLDKADQILDENPLNWNTTDPLAAGMLNHYMYAMIHGYDYHFIQTDKLSDRAPYWSKPMALSRVLKNYDVCVSIDADAIFTHLTLPFEWLLNRWSFRKGATSLAMALDPDKKWNLDSKGRLSTNAGFVIAQNLDRTHDMLKAWSSCPDDEIRYPNCSQWKEPWPAEQRAFADYIRYEYDRPDDVREIPCTEGNGYPEADQGCSGAFVRHYWLKKGDLLKPGVAASLAQAVLGRAHDSLLKNKETVVLTDHPVRGLIQ